jgi:hypothetical protein
MIIKAIYSPLCECSFVLMILTNFPLQMNEIKAIIIILALYLGGIQVYKTLRHANFCYELEYRYS